MGREEGEGEERSGCGYKSNVRDPGDEGTVLYLDCGGRHMDLHM